MLPLRILWPAAAQTSLLWSSGSLLQNLSLTESCEDMYSGNACITHAHMSLPLHLSNNESIMGNKYVNKGRCMFGRAFHDS